MLPARRSGRGEECYGLQRRERWFESNLRLQLPIRAANWNRLAFYKKRHQGLLAPLGAPVPVHLRIERRPGRQRIGRIEVLPRLEKTRAAVLQADLHFSGQDEYPLRLRR